jgi:hypothetical protein
VIVADQTLGAIAESVAAANDKDGVKPGLTAESIVRRSSSRKTISNCIGK